MKVKGELKRLTTKSKIKMIFFDWKRFVVFIYYLAARKIASVSEMRKEITPRDV